MITTSVRGHLASQDFDSSLYGWQKCEPVSLFDAPIETFYRDDMQPLQRMLTRLSQQVQYVILWLDCDREGEAISDEVRQVCLQANPRLTKQHIYRAKFSTVLAPEIERALRTLGRIQEYLVDAVQLRSELDLRVGAAFTRFQTLRLQRQFDWTTVDNGNNNNNNNGGHSSVLSYGPCQFPTLGFVVERWARIQTFVPQDFWTIELSLICNPPETVNNNNGNGNGENGNTDNNTNPQRQEQQQQNSHSGQNNNSNNINNNSSRPIYFTWKRGRLYDQTLATILYETCVDAGPAIVISIQGRPQNRWRPVPLATVELQKRASRYLRIGSEQLMTVAEELYQQGYISYPRTETERFRPEFQHQPLFQQFANLGDTHTEFSSYAQQLLTGGAFQVPRAGQHDDQAHPPITPCKAVAPQSIADANQRGVYTLIVKHYLACCSRDAVGRETTLTVRIGAHEEFTAKGLMILQHNWLEIYQPWERWSTGQGELPQLEVGSRITPHSLILKSGSTTPPLPLSEVELISLMDRNGIGTDATIATHISTIQERDYAVKDASQKFSPTPLGIALIQGYNTMGYQLNKPDLRREMEAECNHVAGGRKAKQQVLVPLLSKMKQTFQTAVTEAHKLDAAMAQHFPRVGTNEQAWSIVQNQFSLCGTCRTPMALKQQQQQPGQNHGRGNNNNNMNRRKLLLFCQTCNVGYPLPRSGIPQPHTNTATSSPTICPICQYQVVKIQRGEGYEGNGYTLCPKCFSSPPVEFGGSAASGGGQAQFKCFECQNSSCSLSSAIVGGETPIFACPFCAATGGTHQTAQTPAQVSLRRNSRGFVVSCNRYQSDQGRRCPYTIWLPKQCQAVSVVPGGPNNNDENQMQSGNAPPEDRSVCHRCSGNGNVVRLISIQWKPGSVPPHFGRETTVCILCDVEFRNEFHINLPQPGQVVPARRTAPGRGGRGGRNTANGGGGGRAGGRGVFGGGGGRGRGRTSTTQYGRGGDGGGGGGGGNVCYVCGQSGHYANNCPNRG